MVRRVCRRCDAVDTAPLRPRSVRAARALLLAIAALGLVQGVFGLVARARFVDAAVEFRTTTLVLRDLVLAELSSSLAYAVWGGLAAAALFVPLVIALRRPRRWARVAACFALTVQAVVQALFLAANPTLLAEPDTSATGRDRVLWDNLVPNWYAPATHLVEVPLIVGAIAVIVLLALDSSREYFSYRFRVASDDKRIWDLPRRAER